jgi:hypothetical protein
MAVKRAKANGHEIKQSVVQLQLIRSENYPTLYANNVQFSASQWDLRLDFGEVQVPPPPPRGSPTPTAQVVLQKVGVILTPAFAKVVAQTLNHMVKIHEEAVAKAPPLVFPEPQ